MNTLTEKERQAIKEVILAMIVETKAYFTTDEVVAAIQKRISEIRKEEAMSKGLVQSIFEQIDSHVWLNTNRCMQLAQEIAKLLTPDVNADTVTKKEMFDFAKYYLKNGITEFMQSVPLLEAYKQFQNAEPK